MKKTIALAIIVLLGISLGAWLWLKPGEGGKLPPASLAEQYGISVSNPLVADVGLSILEQGGNAVDATIAVSLALTVVEPFGSGIGGGGIMLVHPGANQQPQALDYRDVYPFSGTKPQGNTGIPGLVRGLETAHSQWGSLPWEDLVEPALELAQNGFAVDDYFVQRLKINRGRLPVNELPHIFPDGEPLAAGDQLVQPELAETLKRIGSQGAEGFYSGAVAQSVAAKMGVPASDLEQYQARLTSPVEGSFQGYQVYSAPAPASGITLIQILQMMENQTDADEVEFIHDLTSIVSTAFADRIKSVADPEFENVDSQHLSSMDYSRQLAEVDAEKEIEEEPDDGNTTHFVIVDGDGMMVSTTNTLSTFFGSGQYVEGFFLNDQMKNFSSPNSINGPEPGKRSRSFMAPTILVKDGRPVIGIGGPGGNRIPQVMAQVLARHLIFGQSMNEAIAAPRFYLNGKVLYLEEGTSQDVRFRLPEKGYPVATQPSHMLVGAIKSLTIDYQDNLLSGGVDQRRNGIFRWSH